MNRRDWLRRAALIAGGVLAADQVELIERLTPRRYVGGWTPSPLVAYNGEIVVYAGSTEGAFLREAYLNAWPLAMDNCGRMFSGVRVISENMEPEVGGPHVMFRYRLEGPSQVPLPMRLS